LRQRQIVGEGGFQQRIAGLGEALCQQALGQMGLAAIPQKQAKRQLSQQMLRPKRQQLAQRILGGCEIAEALLHLAQLIPGFRQARFPQ
jgi:hypothetical protein